MSGGRPSHSEPLIQNPHTMRYRPLGRTGWRVSALSMGCMRLGEDQALNDRVISRCIELGINYFETTRRYCGGQCQHRVAPGIKGKTRGIIVSGKAALTPDTTAYQFRKEIERQLDILGLTHFKFFQVGWFGWDRMPHLLKRGGVLDALRRAQDEGLVQHFGFTGHDTPENFIRCVETGLFDSITVPYSLINRTYEGLIERAGELGVGVVAMCPLAGGALAAHSEPLRQALGSEFPTPAMALRFVLSNPHVSTACSGMTTVEMVEDNARIVAAFDPDPSLFQGACAGLDRLREAFGSRVCTACRYCLPCPQGVDLPRFMELYRQWKAYGLEEAARQGLRVPPTLDHCDNCGTCEKKCPNQLPIREWLEALRQLGGHLAVGSK